MASLAKASAIYGEDLRPVRPGKPSTRSPVVKLGQGTGDFIVPGPGAYSPGDKNRPRASEWVMGDRNARKSSVQLAGVSPGPVYMMKSSVEAQTISNKASSPRFGFGTQPRLQESSESVSPGPGAYSPRVTKHADPGTIQTVAAGQLTELTTPQGSIQIAEGTWSRKVDRGLATVREGPDAASYSPNIDYTTNKKPAYTMRPLGTRTLVDPGGDVSPGPNMFNLTGDRFGRNQHDTPSYSFTAKNEAPLFISNAHSRIYQGKHSPSPAAYTPLEEFGITSYTISNTSKHAPQYIFGSEVRPCAPPVK